MCDKFAAYFRSKIDKVKASVTTCVQQVRNPMMQKSKSPTTSLDLFEPATEAEVLRVIMRLPNKTSPLDYIYTSVLKSCSSVFVPLITHLINLSFGEGCFPDQFKRAQVTRATAQENWVGWKRSVELSSNLKSEHCREDHRVCMPRTSSTSRGIHRKFQSSAVSLQETALHWNCTPQDTWRPLQNHSQ